MAAGHSPFLQEGLVAAVVHSHRVLGQVQFNNGGDAAGQEFPVMGHQDHPAAEPLHESLEFGQSSQVKIVGWLIQQHYVEAAQQQGRQRHPGCLAAGEPGHGGIRAGFQSQVRKHGRKPLIQVRCARGHPAVKSKRIGVVRAGSTRSQGLRGGLHLSGGLGAAGPACNIARHRFPGHAFMLLRKPAHEGVRGGEADGSVLRLVNTGQQAEQCGLPGAVGTNHPHHITGSHCQGEL